MWQSYLAHLRQNGYLLISMSQHFANVSPHAWSPDFCALCRFYEPRHVQDRIQNNSCSHGFSWTRRVIKQPEFLGHLRLVNCSQRTNRKFPQQQEKMEQKRMLYSFCSLRTNKAFLFQSLWHGKSCQEEVGLPQCFMFSDSEKSALNPKQSQFSSSELSISKTLHFSSKLWEGKDIIRF